MLHCFLRCRWAAHQALGIAPQLRRQGRVGLLGDAEAARDLPELAKAMTPRMEELHAAGDRGRHSIHYDPSATRAAPVFG